MSLAPTKSLTPSAELPLAIRDGKLKRFTIPGRKGVWKYVNGNRKPRNFSRGDHRLLARVQQGKHVVIREFIRIRKWKIATDGMILERLRAGEITIDPLTARVQRLDSNTGMYQILSQYEDRKGYRFVRLYRGDERKKIAVHRLQIMADIDGEIPPGFDIDHRDKDITNNSLSNLRLLSSETNRCTNLNDEF